MYTSSSILRLFGIGKQFKDTNLKQTAIFFQILAVGIVLLKTDPWKCNCIIENNTEMVISNINTLKYDSYTLTF